MIWIFIYILFYFLVFVCEGFLFFNGKNNGTTTQRVTTTARTPIVLNATHPADLPGNDNIDPVEAEAGAIAGAVFGVLVSVGFIAFAGIMYIRRKRERDLEFHRTNKVLKQSSQSAGVYMDTTQEFVHTRTKPTNNQGPEYRSLHKDQNIYESDSEDEL